MNGLKEIGVSLCITAIITGVFSMLVPSKKNNTALKLAINLFFLTSLISPFLLNKVNFYIDTPHITPTVNFVEQSNIQFLEIAKNKIESEIKNSLKKYKINISKISVIINNSEKNGISIDKVLFKLVDNNFNKQAVDIIKQEFNIEAEVYNGFA